MKLGFLGLAGAAAWACACGGSSNSSGGQTAAAATSASSTMASSTASAGSGGAGGSGGMGGGAPMNMCSAAIAMILKPIDQVAQGQVSIVKDMGGSKLVYVDASAGGFGNDDSHPRIYLDLGALMRVAVTDKQASASTAWDLAIKRPVLFTNDGDGGPGKGGTIMVSKSFDQVTAQDAMAMFATESFVDQDCNPKADQTGAVLTTFSGWYDYDQQTNQVTPKQATFIVRGGTGTLYKLAIQSYYGKPDGTTGMAGGYYLLQIGAL